ncbi:MAG: hypothetical protein M1829_002280 [Trizodia sp. TS-e1964]|nr:MAG: hypothetical protein M1829_002280 [Trizodia sp. TS-e1964]
MKLPSDQSVPETSSGQVDKTLFIIAGKELDIYGLKRLAPGSKLACLWLLHPRLMSRKSMKSTALNVLAAWKKRRRAMDQVEEVDLIVAALDQSNHGSRLVSKSANLSWVEGNPMHAQDMYTIYHATAQDTSSLISALPVFIGRRLDINLVLGVSLGGHAAWQLVVSDPRISAAVIVVGCPDYARLMGDRARLSSLDSYVLTNPPGKSFFGSPFFSKYLLDFIRSSDPACLLLNQVYECYEGSSSAPQDKPLINCSEAPIARLQGKKILNIAGADDELVPRRVTEPFLERLTRRMASDSAGWSDDREFELIDQVYEGAGHEFTDAMAHAAQDFICDFLEYKSQDPKIA